MSASGSGDNVSKDAIADKVKQLINDHKVIVFSKTYCIFVIHIFKIEFQLVFCLGPYCVKAKNVLGKYKLKDYKIIELDEIDNGNEYQKILGKLTDAKTVPRVFIAGKCIGGGDDTERLDKNGDLEKQLKKVDAIEN
jgi:glutaredoxin 3